MVREGKSDEKMLERDECVLSGAATVVGGHLGDHCIGDATYGSLSEEAVDGKAPYVGIKSVDDE